MQRISQLTLGGLISCTKKEVENLLDSDLVIRLSKFRTESLRQMRSGAKEIRIREAAAKLLNWSKLDANNAFGSKAVMLLRGKLPQLSLKELQDIAAQRNALGNEADRILNEKLLDLSIEQLQKFAIQKSALGNRAAKLLNEKLRQQQLSIESRKSPTESKHHPAPVPPYLDRGDPYWYLEDDR